jgi:hypothetical protein
MTTPKTDAPKLIYIEWEDAVHNAEWFAFDLAEAWHDQTQHLIRECGWLVKEDKRGITLAGRFKPADNNTDEQFGGLQWIPKTWIHIKKEIKL